MINKPIFIIFCVLISFFSVDVYSQNIYIDSDILSVNRKSNSAHFSGNVVLCFEDFVIKTGNLTISYKENVSKNKIDKIITTSAIALDRSSGSVLIAESTEYIAGQGKLTLSGDVKLEKGSKILKTDKLIHYTKLLSIEHKKQ